MKLFIIILLHSIVLRAGAQQTTDSLYNFDSLAFAKHLIKKSEYPSAISFIKEIKSNETIDSANYLLAIAYYYSGDYYNAGDFLNKLKNKNTLSDIGHTVFINTLIMQQNYSKASEEIINFKTNQPFFIEFSKLQLAGIALLTNNISLYDSIIPTMSNDFIILEDALIHFNESRNKLANIQKKSAIKAALLSMLVPGLGKKYAGYKGMFLGTLFPVLSFAALSTEFYFQKGASNIGFIASTGVFSLFYIGNILGSAYSTKSIINDQYHKVHHIVMHDLDDKLRYFCTE